jgi:lycopene cyclase domain-containing protein
MLYYVAYLLAVLACALVISRAAGLKIDPVPLAKALAPVFALFVLWDIAAVSLGHWQFGTDKMLGIMAYGQPVEELAFFIIIPFMYVVIWEACRKFVK